MAYRGATPEEQSLIADVADGDRKARAVYADLLEVRGELARATFLRFDPADLDAEWLAAVGWVVVGRFLFRLSPEARRAGVMPLGFSLARFDASSGPVLNVSASPLFRPVRLVRLIATAHRRGPSAGGLVLLDQVTVGVDACLERDAAIPLDALAPDGRFGVTLDRTCQVGQEIRATLRCDRVPTAGDSLDVALCVFCQPLPEPTAHPPRLDFGLAAYDDELEDELDAAAELAELDAAAAAAAADLGAAVLHLGLLEAPSPDPDPEPDDSA